MISFAQAKEDVLLWRALAGRVHHSEGFWIDVGAYDPEIDSVTQEFYRHGWRGINVEPVYECFRKFLENRPRDINIHGVASDVSGEVTFHEIVGHQLGTVSKKFADKHAASGFERQSWTAKSFTLAEICEKNAPTQIHFLKIDVEGHEGAVIAGMDFRRFRPWILVIEATEPNDHNAPTYHEWDGLVRSAGYEFAYTDVLNRYYVAQEHQELMSAFLMPADDYVLARDLRRIAELEHELRDVKARMDKMRELLG